MNVNDQNRDESQIAVVTLEQLSDLLACVPDGVVLIVEVSDE